MIFIYFSHTKKNSRLSLNQRNTKISYSFKGQVKIKGKDGNIKLIKAGAEMDEIVVDFLHYNSN